MQPGSMAHASTAALASAPASPRHVCGGLHFTVLVFAPLAFYSFRKTHQTPFFVLGMGCITFFQGVLLLRSAAHSEGPGSWARVHGFHGFLGPQGHERNLFRVFTQKLILEFLHSSKAIFMEPMTFFQTNTRIMIIWVTRGHWATNKLAMCTSLGLGCRFGAK
jgi:hypothetical protein